MKRLSALLLVCLLLLASCKGQDVSQTSSQESSNQESSEATSEPQQTETTVVLTEEAIRDKILGSWVGQAAGVVWGADQEFWYCGTTMPDEKVPDITTLNCNGCFGQDDLYVELPFLQAMNQYGVNCTLDQLAAAFRDTEFPLDHANKIARENLRAGIQAPDSGSYTNNWHCDDIDWMIEADFVGCLYPARADLAAQRAFEIGHIINYGDGVYGGVFVAAMHAAAFTATSVDEIINAGIEAVPEGSEIRKLLEDIVSWHGENITWQECWQKLQDKWDKTSRCPWYAQSATNIDAKLNAGYVLIGLLYGEGNFEKSMQIAMQCGQDSDCNPSTVGAVLGNWIGYRELDAVWKKIDRTGSHFSYTEISFDDAVNLNCKLALQALEANGSTSDNGSWSITVPDQYESLPLEQWPAGPTGEIAVVSDGSEIVRLSVKAHDISGIASYSWDMGDGGKAEGDVSAYVYKEIGTYTVTCTVTSTEGNTLTLQSEVTVDRITPSEDDTSRGTYHNVMAYGTILCSVYAPTGSGSTNLETIRDGILTGGNTAQYDTYAGYLPSHDDRIGYLFHAPYEVDKIVFTEGMHFNNGGWFIGETLRVEALIDGVWQSVPYTVEPSYPTGNNQSAYGANFQTYTFTFDAVSCAGICLVGTAGGDAGFVGIAELEVWGS